MWWKENHRGVITLVKGKFEVLRNNSVFRRVEEVECLKGVVRVDDIEGDVYDLYGNPTFYL